MEDRWSAEIMCLLERLDGSGRMPEFRLNLSFLFLFLLAAFHVFVTLPVSGYIWLVCLMLDLNDFSRKLTRHGAGRMVHVDAGVLPGSHCSRW